MIRLDEKQYRAVKKMTRAACANNDCGNCLLDDGETCVCVQSISYSLLCRYFREAVLPADRQLCEQITRSGNRFEALRGMRQHVCGGQQPGEILPRLRGKDTPQTESPKREKQAFTDKTTTLKHSKRVPVCEMPALPIERGHFVLKIEKGRDETICRILHTTMTN